MYNMRVKVKKIKEKIKTNIKETFRFWFPFQLGVNGL